jgi:hypothetical protein
MISSAKNYTETCSGAKNDKFHYINVCYIKIVVLTVLYSHLLRYIHNRMHIIKVASSGIEPGIKFKEIISHVQGIYRFRMILKMILSCGQFNDDGQEVTL